MSKPTGPSRQSDTKGVGSERSSFPRDAGPRWPADGAGRGDAQEAVALWRRIDAALSPILGEQGVAALFQRAVYDTRAHYPWLADVQENGLRVGDFAALETALGPQTSADAVAAQRALLASFYETLAILIGAALAERLLRPVLGGALEHAVDEPRRGDAPGVEPRRDDAPVIEKETP